MIFLVGKGSPMSWEIAEGRNKIVFSLFEAVEDVDTGQIYLKKIFRLQGNELFHEWRKLQGDMQEEMVVAFLNHYPNIKASSQEDDSTYYRKRNRSHDKIDIDRSFREAFNKIRVCDPDNYPALFRVNGRKFKAVVMPLED